MREMGQYAVKSAAAVAARVASIESRDCHTAPLWPMNVPILKALVDCFPVIHLL